MVKSVDIPYLHYLLLKWASPMEKQVLQMERWLVTPQGTAAEVTEERDAKTQKRNTGTLTVYLNDREIGVMDAVMSCCLMIP